MARNPDLGALEEVRLLRFISHQSKGFFPLTSLKQQLTNLKQGKKEGVSHTEIAQAVLKDFEPYGEVRFDLGQFWQWRGACWEPLDEAVIRKHIQDEYGELPAAKRSNDHKGIVSVMRDQCRQELVSQAVTGVNFANGFLAEDLKLVPHHPDFGMTYVLPYRYLPEDTKCPMFMQYLADSWGDDPDVQDKIAALQEAMAATMMGIAPHYQRAICLLGQPGSGKSRIPVFLRGLMPEGCSSTVPPTAWADKFMPAMMAGKLINFAGEISEDRPIPGDRFKEIVEGTRISAQFKNKPIFEFSPKAARWFCSNHLPHTKDTSGGFTRRWLMLGFSHEVPAKILNRALAEEILATEREQIVAWVLQGLLRLKQRGDYTLPCSHHALVEEMAVKNNSVHLFLVECPRLRVGEKFHKDRSEIEICGERIYNEYWTYCGTSGGVRRVVRPQFHQLMKELAPKLGFQQLKKRANHGVETTYRYITLAGR